MPNYEPITQLNTNLGWWFYKGYYKGGLNWNDLKGDDNNKTYFKKVNDVLIAAKLPKVVTKNQGNYSPQYLTTYPGLVMGVGYQHETGAMGEAKIGFYFDYTTGLPCLAGSSVKGIIRSAFPQFKALENNILIPDSQNKNQNKNNLKKNIKIAQSKAKYIASLLGWAYVDDRDLFTDVYQLELALFAGVDIKKSNDEGLEYHSIYKRDIFHDAFPVEATNNKLLGEDFITSHVGGAKSESEIVQKSLKEPNPILFLKIIPNVLFRFDFKVFENDILIRDKKVTPQNRQDLYAKIISDFGVGAKTNVGYGQFSISETNGSDEDNNSNNKIQTIEFLHKGPFNPKKRYFLEAIVTKSGTPNFVSVYVQEGIICENIKLDVMRNTIPVGQIVKVEVNIVNNKVTQASYKGDKL
jgi:CRISPR-associated protein Cmr6